MSSQDTPGATEEYVLYGYFSKINIHCPGPHVQPKNRIGIKWSFPKTNINCRGTPDKTYKCLLYDHFPKINISCTKRRERGRGREGGKVRGREREQY